MTANEELLARAKRARELVWWGEAPHPRCIEISDALDALVAALRAAEDHAELSALRAERDACKLQAQSHAKEARTANATIAEIYQLCTGATGEPGNWNGAGPVRELVAERDALRALLVARNEAIIEWARVLDRAGEKFAFDPQDDNAATFFIAVSQNACLARGAAEVQLAELAQGGPRQGRARRARPPRARAAARRANEGEHEGA